ncbi:hypothetical protein J008_01433 [Cryptococcus neoformans]|nr:hypothetical protein C362_00960 [Cryptococcus neoformans var. grubii Bt1]OXH39887.1 hypothetical protein J008_01433 [Cryptococcus neoformans var. grubii]
MGMNNYPSPCTKAVNSILRAIDHVHNARRILNFEDMGDDLYYDGVGTIENMKKIFLHYLHRNTFKALRDFTAQAIGIPGFSVLATNFKTTLASLSLRHFQDEGPAPCYGVVTNHESKIQYATLLRNKDVDRCPVSFLALMLFASPSQIQILLSLSSKVVVTGAPSLTLSRAKAIIYISTSANPSRKWGTQLAGQGRAPEEEIPRHGRWCRKVMETTTSTTSQAMRILVVHPSKKGAYHLPRDVDVPKELRAIWFSLGPTTPELNDPNRQEDDKAGRTFVELLCYLSKVIVQDAPFLRRFVPDLYVWKEPLFSAPSFVAFEAKILAEVEIAQTTTSQQLRQVMLELANFISTNFKPVTDSSSSRPVTTLLLLSVCRSIC